MEYPIFSVFLISLSAHAIPTHSRFPWRSFRRQKWFVETGQNGFSEINKNPKHVCDPFTCLDSLFNCSIRKKQQATERAAVGMGLTINEVQTKNTATNVKEIIKKIINKQ